MPRAGDAISVGGVGEAAAAITGLRLDLCPCLCFRAGWAVPGVGDDPLEGGLVDYDGIIGFRTGCDLFLCAAASCLGDPSIGHGRASLIWSGPVAASSAY